MAIVWVILAMAKCGQMVKFGHLAIFGHSQHGPKYEHDGYLLKEHKKNKSLVKVSSDLDAWLNGQIKNFRTFPYVRSLCKTKKVYANWHAKFLIFVYSWLYLWPVIVLKKILAFP